MRVAALASLLGLVSVPLLAVQNDDTAQTVAQFAAAVNAGAGLNTFALSSALSASELTAISSLEGCVPAVADGSRSEWIKLDWSCQEAREFERQTALKFDRDGAFSVWINPLEAKLSPTPVALTSAKLPGYRSITRSFAEAVKAGEDPTLGGMIPITPEHLSKLTEFRDLSYRTGTGNSSRSQAMFWDVQGKVLERPIVTDLKFDSEGRPIGLIISATSRTKGVG